MQQDVNFEKTRRHNDEALLERIEAIRDGTDIAALSSFAKAYLGLYLEIDDDLDPISRVRTLANPRLAEAVLEGFVPALMHAALPSPREIGTLMANNERPAIGYVALAALDGIARGSTRAALELDEAKLQALLCFHYANVPNDRAAWVVELLAERPALVALALRDFWVSLVAGGTDHLPGLTQVLEAADGAFILQHSVLPVLQAWPQCRRQFLRDLLHAALRHADRRQLLQIARIRLAEGDALDVARQTYWLATAFLLCPDEYGQVLADYAGRSRDKILPLLDFTHAALLKGKGGSVDLPPAALAHLLRIIAPQFRRNRHDMGGLDATSQKVLELFDYLAADSSREAMAAVEALGRVRVMGKYADVLDQVAAAQRRAH